MQIYDISLTISPNLPVWPGDSPILLEKAADMAAGDDVNITRLSFGAHTGTHVDAPLHFLGDDPRTVEWMDLKTLTGRAYVLHLADTAAIIDRSLLERSNIPKRTRRLLIRTRNSHLWEQGISEFQTDFVAIDGSGAEFLLEHGVKLVGVDYLSVAPYSDPHTTHRLLLNAGMIIVEGLDLSGVAQGRYTLYCLPLKLKGSEGAPARTILVGP